jgi:hypothetical protein
MERFVTMITGYDPVVSTTILLCALATNATPTLTQVAKRDKSAVFMNVSKPPAALLDLWPNFMHSRDSTKPNVI